MSVENIKNPQFTVQVVDNGYILATEVPDKGKCIGIAGIHVYRGLEDLQNAIEEWVYAVREGSPAESA